MIMVNKKLSNKKKGKIEDLVQQAVALHRHGELSSAVQRLEAALAIDPKNFVALHGIGIVYGEMNRCKESLRYFDAALEVQPGNFAAHYNCGKLLQNHKRFEEALASYDQAISIKPDFADAYNNRGITLSELNRYDDALASLDKAIVLKPDSAEIRHNRGNVLRVMHRYAEAMASYDEALAINPDHADAQYGKGLLKLLLGEFEEGLLLCEWRWKTPQKKSSLRNFKQPLWLGDQSLENKTVLLYAEQGFGDTIQYVRYAPLVAALGASVVLEAQPALTTLLEDLDGIDTVIASGSVPPAFDMQCPLGSLPLAFHTTVATIPAETPYLTVDQKRRNKWRERLGLKTRARVGLTWSGNVKFMNDRKRSVPLSFLRPLMGLNVEYHSLQKEIRDEDRATFADIEVIRNHVDELHDFSDTAALVAELDLVITVDTAVAHLAGALGKEVWILLPYAPDHRWLIERTDSPWYPSATLFRAGYNWNWGGVITDVRSHLQEKYGAKLQSLS